VNSGSANCTGIGVVAGFLAVVLMLGGPHVKKVDSHGSIQIFPILQEVRPVCKTRNQFVECYQHGNLSLRQETERFRRFTYEELVQRDKLNLDTFWLKDDSLEDIDSLPAPDVIAAEIVENLEAALEQYRGVAEGLLTS
jgi:type I restriction enzyme M protein